MEPSGPPDHKSPSLIGHDINWDYGLLNGPNGTRIPRNESKAPKSVTELTPGALQYVGCRVVNGYPMPHITLNGGELDLLGASTLMWKPTTSAGPAGYEVPQFDQRIEYFFNVTWKYDRRIATCQADNTVESMDTVASTTLSVKGNTPLTVFSYRRSSINKS